MRTQNSCVYCVLTLWIYSLRPLLTCLPLVRSHSNHCRRSVSLFFPKVCKQPQSGRDFQLNDLRWGAAICGLFHWKVLFSSSTLWMVSELHTKGSWMRMQTTGGWVEHGAFLGELFWENEKPLTRGWCRQFVQIAMIRPLFPLMMGWNFINNFFKPQNNNNNNTAEQNIQPKTRTGLFAGGSDPNDPVDDYWMLVCEGWMSYFCTKINFTSKGETMLQVFESIFTALECKWSAGHYKLVGPLQIWPSWRDIDRLNETMLFCVWRCLQILLVCVWQESVLFLSHF